MAVISELKITLLPKEYQQIEYIESTGEQYIDSNFYPDSNTSVEIELLVKSTIDSKNNFIFGTNNADNSKRFALNLFYSVNNQNLGVYPRYSINSPSANVKIIEFEKWYNYRLEKGKYYVDNVLVASYSETFEKNDYPLYINAYNNNGSLNSTYIGSTKIKSCKIWDNETLVRNYIPCYRVSDNIVGLYDLVEDKFYTSKGTSEFYAGNIYGIITKYNNATISNINFNGADYHFAKSNQVADGVCDDAVEEPLIDMKIYGNSKQSTLPSEYQQVEYIQTTGTQYIDSGVPLKCGLKILVDWKYQDSSSGNNYTGGHIGSPGNRWLIGSQRQKYYYFAIGPSNVSTEFEYGNRDVVEAYWDNKASYIIVNGVKSTKYQYENYALADASDYTFFISATNRDGSASLKPNLTIYSWKFYQNDILVRDYIPCYRKSDNKIGLYDLINDVFYENNGTGEFIKGNSVPNLETPIQIESVGEKTLNLFNKEDLIEHYYLDSTGAQVYHAGTQAGRYWCHTDYIPVKENTTYTFVTDTYGTAPKICMYNSSKEFIGFADQALNFITIANTKYIRLNVYIPQDNIQLEEGSVATNYEPYGYKVPIKINNIVTNTYIKEPLRKIDDYADYIDYKNKKVVRNISKYVFQGNESGAISKTYNNNQSYYIAGPNLKLMNIKSGEKLLCNILPYVYSTQGNSEGFSIGYGGNTSLLYIALPLNNATTFQEVINILKDNAVYGISVTPTEETIELPNIETSKGTNIFDIETSIKPSSLQIEYWKQI